jgi:hypothetical protein
MRLVQQQQQLLEWFVVREGERGLSKGVGGWK